jgi:hypothetical protein
MTMLVLFLVLIVIAVLAPRYGVDSRAPWHPPRHATPAADLVALGRRLRTGLRSG